MSHLEQAASAEHVRPFDLRDRGLLLADGVFDTSMVVRGVVTFRDNHVERLMRDAEGIGIQVDRKRIDAAIEATLAEAAELSLAALRVTVTRGPGARGLVPSGAGAPTILSAAAPVDPARVFTSARVAPTAIRRNETSPTSRHKTLAYLDSVLATREAQGAGADEALFLNTRGRIACCAAANVFLLKDGELATPPAAEGALPGVIRGWVLANAHRAGLTAHERAITAEEAASAEAAFLTSSLRLIAPASGITASDAPAPDAVRRLMALLCEALPADGKPLPFGPPPAQA